MAINFKAKSCFGEENLIFTRMVIVLKPNPDLTLHYRLTCSALPHIMVYSNAWKWFLFLCGLQKCQQRCQNKETVAKCFRDVLLRKHCFSFGFVSKFPLKVGRNLRIIALLLFLYESHLTRTGWQML